MGIRSFPYGLLMLAGLILGQQVQGHPLRLSLSEIEYSSDEQRLTVSLRLFLMDVNEALVFDPDSNELAFGQPHESPQAEPMLLDYLNRFFALTVNGRLLELHIVEKTLSGEGDNRALGVLFEFEQVPPLVSLEVKNAVFTDLFFDQSNIIYVYVDDDSRSLMLNKKTPAHTLTF